MNRTLCGDKATRWDGAYCISANAPTSCRDEEILSDTNTLGQGDSQLFISFCFILLVLGIGDNGLISVIIDDIRDRF